MFCVWFRVVFRPGRENFAPSQTHRSVGRLAPARELPLSPVWLGTPRSWLIARAWFCVCFSGLLWFGTDPTVSGTRTTEVLVTRSAVRVQGVGAWECGTVNMVAVVWSGVGGCRRGGDVGTRTSSKNKKAWRYNTSWKSVIMGMMRERKRSQLLGKYVLLRGACREWCVQTR